MLFYLFLLNILFFKIFLLQEIEEQMNFDLNLDDSSDEDDEEDDND